MKTDYILRICITLLGCVLLSFIISSFFVDIQGRPIIYVDEEIQKKLSSLANIIALIGIILASCIYYIDLHFYAKQLYYHNQKGHGLINQYRYILHKKEEEYIKLEKRYNICLSEKKDIESNYQEKNSKQIINLQNEINALNKNIIEIQTQKAELEKRIENIQVTPNFSNVCLSKLKNTASHRKLKELANKNKKGEEYLFVELEAEITSIYPNFTTVLYEYNPKLTEKQLNLCLLLKAEFSNNEIANLLCLHHSSVSHLKSRIFSAITSTTSASNLSDFLKTL